MAKGTDATRVAGLGRLAAPQDRHLKPEDRAAARRPLSTPIGRPSVDQGGTIAGRVRCRRSGGVVERPPGRTARKAAPCCSGVMPMPVSVTVKARAHGAVGSSPAPRRADDDSPSSVNLTALPIRLIRIWRSRVGVADERAGSRRRCRQASAQALHRRAAADSFAAPSISVRRANGAASSSSAGLDLGEVEDVVDDAQQRLAPSRGPS